MPNNKIDPGLHAALANAFGGGQPAAVQHPSAPPPPPSGDSGGGSFFEALLGPKEAPQAAVAPVAKDPYQNAARVLTGR